MSVEILTQSEIDVSQIWPQETVFVLPTTDIAMASRCAKLMDQRAQSDLHILLVLDVDCVGFVAVCNQLFRQTSGIYFGYTAQDAFPGRQWLAIAKKALDTDDGYLLGFNDGKWHGMLAAFGLVRREWAKMNYGGNLFDSNYFSHYADVELTLLAMQQMKYRYDPRSVLIEVDWEKDRKPTRVEDKHLFAERLSKEFDGRVKDARLLKLFK